MQPFKPSIGYLALTHKIDVLPIYLAGTHEAMPKGRMLPESGAKVSAHIGPLLTYDRLRAAASKVPRHDQNREATRVVEKAVRDLCPSGPNREMPAAGTNASEDEQ
jgi:long-chain acyl-CoA synthetase